MAGYTLIAIRGVLCEHGDDESPAAAKPIGAGLQLYRGLGQVSKLVVVNDHPEPDKVQYWLKAHGLRDHTQFLQNTRTDDPREGRHELLTEARRLGSVDLAIEGDPAMAAKMLHLGVTSLLMTTPAYTRQEFRPDAPRSGRAWSELLEEIDAQDELRKSDTRITADIAGTRFEDE